MPSQNYVPGTITTTPQVDARKRQHVVPTARTGGERDAAGAAQEMEARTTGGGNRVKSEAIAIMMDARAVEVKREALEEAMQVVPELTGTVTTEVPESEDTQMRDDGNEEIEEEGEEDEAVRLHRLGVEETASGNRTSGGNVATSPNFTRIYGFFAMLFDPTKPYSVMNVVQRSELSALDWEIIKLLVRNLEVNVDSVAFRQQLVDTYRQQQMRLQQQHSPPH